MKVYTTSAVIEFLDGAVIKQHTGAFETEEQAVGHATELSELLSQLLSMKVGDSGLAFEEALAHLGVSRIAHDMETVVPVMASKIVSA